jgi:hypothetical protein
MSKDMDRDDVTRRLAELEKRVEKLEKHFVGVGLISTTKAKKLSAKEFLMTKNPKAETQKVLALGYFLERMEGMKSFNVPDLEAAFRLAKEKLPKNMNDAVNKNISRAFLMEAEEKKDSKKAWYLTSTGERHVENAMKQ